MVEPNYYFKFLAGLQGLAEGEGTLRERLLWALQSYAGLTDDQLPPDILETYLDLRAHVTWCKDGDPRAWDWSNTLNAMSDEDARKVARLIVRLFEQSVERLRPADRL